MKNKEGQGSASEKAAIVTGNRGSKECNPEEVCYSDVTIQFHRYGKQSRWPFPEQEGGRQGSHLPQGVEQQQEGHHDQENTNKELVRGEVPGIIHPTY